MTPATHIIPPPQRVWILLAPAAVWSSAPLVSYDLETCEALIDQGYLVTGPYILDPAAALQADQEVRASQADLEYRIQARKIAGTTLDTDRPNL